MIKKFIFTTIFAAALLFIGAPCAQSATPTADAKTTPQAADKQVKKTTAPSEDKYPAAYAKWTKAAEADETKYDQIFDDCMDKSGFPQEEFNTDGAPIDGGDGQED